MTTREKSTQSTTDRAIAERANRGAILDGEHSFNVISIHRDIDKDGNPRSLINIKTENGERAVIFLTVKSGITARAIIELLDVFEIDNVDDIKDASLTAVFRSNKGFNNIVSFIL